MEPNILMRILGWIFEGKDAPAKVLLILALMFLVASLIRAVVR